MNQPTYRIKKPAVVSETIDGEVVIIQLTHGYYYSMDGTAARIWDWIESGHSLASIEAGLLTIFEGRAEDVRSALVEFIGRLVAEELIEEAEHASATDGVQALASAGNGARPHFEAPILQRYADMQDLLLLDPIHDVNEMGWPTPKDS